jgi:hypothetical protein
MNTLFLVNEPITEFDGISKKILAQVNALKRMGMEVELSYFGTNDKKEITGRYVDEKMIDKYSSISLINKLQCWLSYKNLYRYATKNKIQLVYIRYTHFANPFFISFLKKLKKNGTIILMEIPTYPYDQEYRNLKTISKIVLWIERLSRQGFKKCVTRIVTLSHDTNIFGVPTVQISNGIEPGSINMVQKRLPDGNINLIAVASMGLWHGYDRIIEGLHNYYHKSKISRVKVYFHLVGNDNKAGIETFRYVEMIEKYRLHEYIILHNKKSGKELDRLFDEADMAVGSLGGHRIAIKYIKALKSREYCARGVPFFYSAIDPDFEGQDFIYKVPPNDEPIEIEKIVDFINTNTFNPVKIREYALNNLTWDKQFEKILQSIGINYKPVDTLTLDSHNEKLLLLAETTR